MQSMQLFILLIAYPAAKALAMSEILYPWASIQTASAALGDDFQLKLWISPNLSAESRVQVLHQPRIELCNESNIKHWGN